MPPSILWTAGMETGDLSEWSEQVNNGDALSTAVQAAAAVSRRAQRHG